MTVTNVNSHSLGVLGTDPETGRPRTQVMIPANTILPAKNTCRFKTRDVGQKDVAVMIVEGGDSSGKNSTPIGQCVIRDLPPALPSGTPVRVTFAYRADGRLAVHAELPTIQKEAQLEIQRASGLSDIGVEQWAARINNRMKAQT